MPIVQMSRFQSVMARVAAHGRLAAAQLGVGFEQTSSLEDHLAAAIDWLCRAQDATSDAGVAQAYFVQSRRWAQSYPETTGYIIPTFLRYAENTGDAQVRDRARRMADWECDIQLPDGGVVAGAIGDSDQPTIFNTGQVIFGWVRAAEAFGDERYYESARRAADWLCAVQDDDGCWRRFGSPMTPDAINTYNSRTAWALTRAHQLIADQRYLDAAVANCDWALTQRRPNGWLKQNCLLDPSQPFVHTIAYAMRGLLEVGAYADRRHFIDAAVAIGDAMLAALPKSGFLPGRFDQYWRPTVGWSCLTGNAQMAINWGRLYQIDGQSAFRNAVVRINGFTRSTQILDLNNPMCGGIKGSYPIDGGYHPWQYPNWSAKFFADALMMEFDLTKNADTTARPLPG